MLEFAGDAIPAGPWGLVGLFVVAVVIVWALFALARRFF